MKKKFQKTLHLQRKRRVGRVRARVRGTAGRPRLAVHRSVRYFGAQLIDDVAGKTLVAVHSKQLKTKKKMKKMEASTALGELLAKKAKEAGLEAVVFDRRHYKYHGRVRAFADAAREGGLKF
jgi:large subunit ribosomal protein L18